MLARLRSYWPLIALVVSGAALAAAHAFESFGHLQPCALCLEQRERHWLVVGAAVVLILAGFTPLRARPWFGLGAAIILAALYAFSFASAAHHFAVEQHWLPATCDVIRDLSHLAPMSGGAFEAPRCDVPQWSLFGITMAGYNAALSLAMTLASVAVAVAPARKAA